MPFARRQTTVGSSKQRKYADTQMLQSSVMKTDKYIGGLSNRVDTV